MYLDNLLLFFIFIGIIHCMDDNLKKVCSVDDIHLNSSKNFNIEEKSILITNCNNEFFATDLKCTHPFDRDLLVKNLSRGQKSRFQIVKILSNNPNLLIFR